jgi:hypothetical protein
MPMGWVRSLRLAELLLRRKIGSRYWQVALLVVVRGVRRSAGRTGRGVGGLFGGVRGRRALLVAVIVAAEV